MRPKKHRQAGVTLIEIMVSIVVVSFGLLGVAGLVTTGLKSTQASQYRTQASYFAYDMADRMRANRQAAREGEYATTTTAANAVAVRDKTCWHGALNGTAPSNCHAPTGLPSGEGTVVMASAPNTDVFTITVSWDESKLAGGRADQSFVFRGEL